MLRRSLFLSLCLAGALSIAQSDVAARQESDIDCSSSDEVTRTICDDPTLMEAAETMAAALQDMAARLTPERQQLLVFYVNNRLSFLQVCVDRTPVDKSCIQEKLDQITQILSARPSMESADAPRFQTFIDGGIENESSVATILYPQAENPALLAFNQAVAAVALQDDRWRVEGGPFYYNLGFGISYASGQLISVTFTTVFARTKAGKYRLDDPTHEAVNWLVKADAPLSASDLIAPDKLSAAVAHCRDQDGYLWRSEGPPPDEVIAAVLMRPDAWTFTESGAATYFALKGVDLNPLALCVFTWKQLREFVAEDSRLPFPDEP